MDTYEKMQVSTELETFEWDNPWWEHTENRTSPRFLYIGDSISRGTVFPLNAQGAGEILFDNFSTSKALDNPFFEPSLELFMSQQIRCDGIVFNNGLHGWHLSDAEYEEGFGKMLGFLKKRGVPVYILLTTFLPDDPERNEKVISRNAAACRAGESFGCGIIDLYEVSKTECAGLYCGDGVHLKTGGYEKLAAKILETVR